jgi:ParB family transcriptional regulator, chromosome partitioning protein
MVKRVGLEEAVIDRPKQQQQLQALVAPGVIDAVNQQEEIRVHWSLIETTFTFTPDYRPLRHFYDQERIESWAKTDLAINGILTALWVRPHPSLRGRYELVAGRRRLYGAEFINADVPIKIFNWSDDQAYSAALSENANREDFTPLEEADLILAMLSTKLKMKVEDVVSVLQNLTNEDKGKIQRNPDREGIRAQILEVFDAYGQIRFATFVSKRLVLRNCTPEILDSIRIGKISCTAGMEIDKVKDPQDRENLLRMAIEDKFTVSQIKNHIRGVSRSEKKGRPVSAEVSSSLDKIRKLMKTKKVDPDKTQKVNSWMALIEKELELL